MIRTTREKTESVPKELPPGWDLDEQTKNYSGGYRAINHDRVLRTLTFVTEAEMIASAHEIEKLQEEGLLGLTGKGLVSPSPEAAGKGEPGLEKALHSALHQVQGAAERWKPLILNGATDAKLTAAIGREFGLGGGASTHGGYRYKGGKSPEFSWPGYADQSKAQTIKGKRLLAKVREILGIGAHKAELPLCLNCGEQAGEGHVCPKPLVDPSLLCVCGHRADAGESNGYHPQMLRMIPVDQIEPSPTNPRKYFDPDKLRELADSIIEHGLVEPILVRPLREKNEDGKLFELVAGERRWRAVILAKLERIEAKVRDLDDKAVLEIQFIENLQRADLSPIEEAEGYKRLLDEHGYTADSLAGKLGKSKSYVYGRLKLCNLPPAALEAIAKGDVPATIGELIGRLPSMEMREEFWTEHYGGLGQKWFEEPSFRQVKETIESEWTRELKSAPFPQNDKKLCPAAGSCKDCPKRTGNDRASYPDSRADMCADTDCFDRKLKAHFERQVEKAKNSGAKVLSEAESKKLFDNAGDAAWLNFSAKQKYVELKDQPSGDKEDRSYKQLLEGHLEPVVAVDPLGKVHYLAPKAEAEKILKEQYKIKAQSSSNTDSYKASEKKRAEEKKLRQATAAEIVTRAITDWPFSPLAASAFLRVMAKSLISDGHFDIALAIAKRRGIEYDSAKVRGSLARIVDRMEAEDVPGLIVEYLLTRELGSWVNWGGDSGDKFPVCDYFDLKPKAVMKEVAAKAKETAKKKTPREKLKAIARG